MMRKSLSPTRSAVASKGKTKEVLGGKEEEEERVMGLFLLLLVCKGWSIGPGKAVCTSARKKGGENGLRTFFLALLYGTYPLVYSCRNLFSENQNFSPAFREPSNCKRAP